MVFADCVTRRWLDFVPGLGLVAFVVASLFPSVSYAVGGTYPTYAEALAACEAFHLSSIYPGNQPGAVIEGEDCKARMINPNPAYGELEKVGTVNGVARTGFGGTETNWGDFYFYGPIPPPPNSCADEPDSQAFVDARDIASAETHQICIAGGGQTDPKGCVQKFTNGSSMGIRPPGFVNYLFIGSWHSTGGTCTQNADGTWTADDTGTSPPNAQPKPTTAPPKLCGGGSCIDPSTGKACIVDSGGKQFCTPGPVTDPDAASGCYSDGSSTLCAGPKPPLPNPPPITPVTDPATDITSSDRYGTMSPGGTTSTTIVNNYTSGSTSGQGSDDLGPAPPSSTGGTGTGTAGDGTGGKGFAGGTDCNTPPVCTGDASLCGIARVNWSNLCRLHRDVGSDDPAPSLSSLAPADSASLWSDAGSSASGIAAAAMQGNFDGTGFGYGVACPMKDLALSVAGRSFAVPMSNACVVGPWVRGLLLAFATLWAAMIVVKGD